MGYRSNGLTGNLTTGHQLVSTATGEVTIGGWINLLSTADDGVVFYVGNTGGDGWGLYVSSGDLRGLLGGKTFGASATASTGLNHVMLRRLSGTWQIFVDGSAVGSTNGTDPNTPTLGGQLSLGIDAVQLGEWGLWESALSTANITKLAVDKYAPDLVNPGRSLRHYWPLDEDSRDRVGNASMLPTGGMLRGMHIPGIVKRERRARVAFRAPAAAGGLSIPVAMHHYRRQMQGV